MRRRPARTINLVATLVAAVTLGAAPATAGDGVANTGRRLAAEAATRDTSMGAWGRPAHGVRPVTDARLERAEQPPTGLTRSGMSRRKKVALGLALAVGFGAIVWAIDHGVEDNTLSSRGLR